MQGDPPAIVAADIGAVRAIPNSRFAWWSSAGASGEYPSTLADHVASLLREGRPVALGFECPLFVPLRENEHTLTKARPGECPKGRRAAPWSGSGGAGALTVGLVQVPWVLSCIRSGAPASTRAFLDWEAFCEHGQGLFLWEAFVTGSDKTGSHRGDARVAAEAFRQALPDPLAVSAVICDDECYSLIGAALLRTGWSNALDLLHTPCLVIRSGTHVS